MDIPILLGADPKTANPSAWIPIRFKSWEVRVEGLVDSEITLHSNLFTEDFVDYVILSDLNKAVFFGPCQVRTKIKKKGTENSISVFVKEYKEK